MNTNLKNWFDFLEGDKNLSQKLLLKKRDYEVKGKDFDSFIAEVFKPEAEKHGFEFSEDDVKEFIKATGVQELSMDELEDVAGGRSKVLMNIGVVSMALMSILPMASMFTSKNNATENTNAAIVETIQDGSSSRKVVNQKKDNNSTNVQNIKKDNAVSNTSTSKKD